MVERPIDNRKVTGSIPVSPTNFNLDKPSEGGSPPDSKVKEKLFNRWDGGCPTPCDRLIV